MVVNILYAKFIFGIANVFIAIFIIVFAIFFLKKTEPIEDRKPWIYLMIAMIFFFVFEALNVFGLYNMPIWPEAKDFLKTFFIAIMLYVFVYQHYLISKAKNITIKRKKSGKERKL